MNLTKIKQLAQDIKTIKIQWATNIAREAMKTFADEIENNKLSSILELKKFTKESDKLIRNARATEPMLFNWLNIVVKIIKELSSKYNDKDVKLLQNLMSAAARSYVAEIEYEDKIRPAIWAKLIKSWYNIVTHCHSWSVVRVLAHAWNKKKKIHVYNTETRPLYQWRKTSKNLMDAWVPNTMITDWSAPFFVDNIYESDIDIDMVIIWSDAIKLDWSVYNKVWSFAIALSAWHSKIPVYIVWSLKKVDTEKKVTIEKRSGKELRPEAPKWLDILNYAFDMIPAKFITWIITGEGIIKPSDIKKFIKKINK